MEATYCFVSAAVCALCRSTIRKIFPSMSWSNFPRQSMNVAAFVFPSRNEKCGRIQTVSASLDFRGYAVMLRQVPRLAGLAGLAGLPGFLRLWLVRGMAGEIGRL